MSVSERTIRRRIGKLGAFERDAARYGEDYAIRKYLPVGEGLDISVPMQRIEMDDWTADLHTLIIGTKEWEKLSDKQKAKVPRCRCTITIGIDVATKTIVGFNLTVEDPSARGAAAAARSTMIDKNAWAREARTMSDWPMFGRPEKIVTDGGPAFQNQNFRMAVRRALTGRALPDKDPRMRGTIESFFRGFRRICRFFAGRAFSNVVELGDYKAAEMASLTVEQFRHACILYIVDRYHHQKHRGLEYGTPYAAWRKLSAAGLAMPPSRSNLRLAFGQTYEATLDKNGVLLFGNSYQSDELNELLKLQGIGRVRMIGDPNDLDAVFVYVTSKEHRTELRLRGMTTFNGYVEARCMGAPSTTIEGYGTDTPFAPAPMTKERVLDTNAAVREQAKAEQQEGAEFRRHANSKLLMLGESSMETAGTTKAHRWSPERANKLKQQVAPKQQAALGEVEHADSPVEITQHGLVKSSQLPSDGTERALCRLRLIRLRHHLLPPQTAGAQAAASIRKAGSNGRS